jgi:hypothetical protein
MYPCVTSVLERICGKVKTVGIGLAEHASGVFSVVCVDHPHDGTIVWKGKTHADKTYVMCMNRKSSQ